MDTVVSIRLGIIDKNSKETYAIMRYITVAGIVDLVIVNGEVLSNVKTQICPKVKQGRCLSNYINKCQIVVEEKTFLVVFL